MAADHQTGREPACVTEAEWNDLIEFAGPELLVFIRYRIAPHRRHRISADDLLQETVMHAWRSRESFPGHDRNAFLRWLKAIAVHRIRDWVDHEDAARRRGGAAARSLHASISSTGSGVDDSAALAVTVTPERMARFREWAEAMRRVLDELPEDRREIVRLRLIEEKTAEQVAAELSLGVGAVKHRFRIGCEEYRRRLRQLFESRP